MPSTPPSPFNAHADPSPSSLGHLPEGQSWAFDEGVAAVFEDMLQRSIPRYDDMRTMTTALAARFWNKDAPWIMDLGASRGGAVAPLVDRLGAIARFMCLEISDPMRGALEQRFAGWITNGILESRKLDLRYDDLPSRPCSVVLAILTLVFVPIEYRQRIVQQAYNRLAPGGALLMVEKVLAADAETDRVLTDLYYDFKRASGYSQEEIDRKRYALEGVQVPITAAWNEQMLHAAGFRSVDCYWRSGKFAAWLAIRG